MIAISRTGRLLRQLVRVSCARPVLTVLLSVLFAVAGIAYTLHALTFKTSGRDVLPQSAPYVKRYIEYAKNFGELEDIVVVVEARSFEGAKAYAARLVQELRASPVKFERVSYRIDPKQFEGNQLLYLTTDELKEIRDKIFDHQEFMESFAGDPSLARLLEGVNTQLAAAFVSNLFDLGLNDKDLPVDTRFLRMLLEQIGARLDQPAPYRSPWGTLFSFGNEEAGRRLLPLRGQEPALHPGRVAQGGQGQLPRRPEVDRGRPRRHRQAAPELPHRPGRRDGRPRALQRRDVGGISRQRDRHRARLRAHPDRDGVAFGRVGKPILMLIVLAVSIAWSMGVVTLTVGHLSIFSVMFISIVVGIGIDYGIYFLFRYEEEMFLGRGLREALERTAVRTGPGMAIGALTAAGTFYVLMLTDFRGIQELGYIAGTAILLAWLSMMTTFPAVLMLVDRRHLERARERQPRAQQIERLHVPILDRLTRYPVTVLVSSGVATGLALWALPSISFDYNLLNLQAKGTESVVWERRTLAATGRSGFNALASASTLDELREKQRAFERLPSVSEVDSVVRVIPDGQADKIAIIKTFAPLVSPIRIGRSSPVDVERLRQALADIQRRFDVVAAEAGKGLPAELVTIRKQTADLIQRLKTVDRETAEPALSYLQAQLYRDFVAKFYSLQRNLNPRTISIQDVPSDLRRKFVGEDGRFLLQIHPNVDIWEREGAQQFVGDLRKVDPEVTGAPVITYEATRLMERGYLQGTALAFILVGALTIWMIRRIKESMLALLPLLIGLLWTIGLMHLTGLKFNLANVWGLPLIIGTSAEFGLNVVLSYMEGRPRGGPLVARSTVMAVLLNGITTIIGFGNLMVATHQGIFGLGLLLTIGTACGLVTSLVVLPVILRLITKRAAAPAAESLRQTSAA